MTASEIPLPTRTENDRVRLRALTAADVDPWVQAFAEDPDLGVMLGSEQDPNLEEMRVQLERWNARRVEGRGAEFVIAAAASDEFLGAITLFALDWHSRRAEVGIWLRQSARGQGAGSAALALVLDWAFDELGLERVEMTTIPDNAALPRLAETAGFVREGVLRSRNLERGRRVDIIFYGLLRDEWNTNR